MTLTQTGESRVHGYLFVLERALSTFLPRETVADAVREIESHLRERIASAEGSEERVVLERILAELGPPLKVAQAYSAERTLDEAVTTGRIGPMFRAAWHLAVTTVRGFFVGVGLFVAYATGLAFLAVAALKPIFPTNVGIWVTASGIPYNFGAQFPAPADARLIGGYGIIPISAAVGIAVLVLTYRTTRRVLARFRRQTA